MKIKKKLFLCTVITVLITLVLTACSVNNDVDTKLTTKYCEKEVIYFENPSEDFCFTKKIGDNVEFVELEAEIQNIINQLETYLYQYIIKEYNLDWKFTKTEVKVLDFSKIADGEYATYAAMADPCCNIIYLNARLSTFEDLIYRYTHELVHCLIFYNEGSYKFVLLDGNGGNIGYYVGEAFTDLIAADYLKGLGEEKPVDYFLRSSGYASTLAALQALELSIPDMKEMYLKLEAEEFCKRINDLGKMYISDGETVNYGEIFLYQADLNLKSSHSIIYAQNEQEYNNFANIFLRTSFGNYEIVLGISNGLELEKENQAFEFIDNLFEIEGKNSQIEEYLNYFKSCLN